MRRSLFNTLVLLIAFFSLSACATLQQQLEPPKVSVSSVRMLPSQSMAPRFEIGLHVINPNLVPLALKGIAYQIRLEGHEIINGVTSDLPLIKAYGEGDITIVAATDLLGGLQLVSDLLSRPRDSIRYELEAKLDLGRLLPSIRVTDSGRINLQQGRQR